MFLVSLSWVCLLIGLLPGDGVGSDGCGCDLMRLAVGVYKDCVGNVLDRLAIGQRLCGPASDAADEGRGDAIGVESAIREEPKGVFSLGLIGRLVLCDPVDGGEGYERMWSAEIDEEKATIGAEVRDASVDGEVAVVVGYDFAGSGEKVEGGVGEGAVGAPRCRISPEGLGRSEMLLQKGKEARVVDETVLVAAWGWGGVLPEPLQIFSLLLLSVELGEVRLRRSRHCPGDKEERSGGELEVAAHLAISYSSCSISLR